MGFTLYLMKIPMDKFEKSLLVTMPIFYSEAQDSYFEIDPSMQQDWLNFLSNNYIKIQ